VFVCALLWAGSGEGVLFSLQYEGYLVELGWPLLSEGKKYTLNHPTGRINNARGLVLDGSGRLVCIVNVTINNVNNDYVARIPDPYTGQIEFIGNPLRADEEQNALVLTPFRGQKVLWSVPNENAATNGLWIIRYEKDASQYLVDRLDEVYPFTKPAAIASVNKMLYVGTPQNGGQLVQVDPQNNFVKETVSFGLGESILFMSNYDNNTIIWGEEADDGTDIYLVKINTTTYVPTIDYFHIEAIRHFSKGFAFYPSSSQPIDTYDDLKAALGGAGCVMVGWAVVVCALLLSVF